MANFYAAVPQEKLNKLRELEKRLYTECTMEGGEMRDWGNWLNQVFFPSLEELPDELLAAKVPAEELKQYRCTRGTPYGPGTPGFLNPRARNGFYITASSEEKAMDEMQRRFPNEPRSTFTAELWKE